MSKIKLIFLSFILIVSFSTCKNQSPVPEVYVNFIIYLDWPTLLPLSPVGGSVYIPNEGNKGIIVTQHNYKEYSAYDATCTFDPQHEWGRVQIESSTVFAKDTVCGSQFSLVLNGSVTQGPAGISLKEYTVDYNPNEGSLHIHN